MEMPEKSWSISGIEFSLELWPGRVFVPTTVSEQGYRQSGIDDFIHLGSDALAVLRATLIRLGVMQS